MAMKLSFGISARLLASSAGVSIALAEAPAFASLNRLQQSRHLVRAVSVFQLGNVH